MMMKAAVVRGYGSPAEVEVAEYPAPSADRGQVVVRVYAASMNPIDTKLRSGELRPMLRLSFPAVLGFDFAGEITRLGDSVSGWNEGDRVYGRINSKTGGTHAEQVAVAAKVIDRIPSSLSFEEAAALPLTGMTAIQGLEKAGLDRDDRLLVNGAAGGVGSMTVQIGKARGADVTGVCSSEAAPVVSRLGARVLDYTKGELAETNDRFDVVLDTVFNDAPAELRHLLKARGRYVTTGFSPRFALRMVGAALTSRRRYRFIISRADGRRMRELSRLVESGHVQPVIAATYPLEKIADAHRHVESGHTHGKVVVRIE